MKVKVELDLTPDEFQELFIPSDKQEEFVVKAYTAYCEAMQQLMISNFDPTKFFSKK